MKRQEKQTHDRQPRQDWALVTREDGRPAPRGYVRGSSGVTVKGSPVDHVAWYAKEPSGGMVYAVREDGSSEFLGEVRARSSMIAPSGCMFASIIDRAYVSGSSSDTLKAGPS
jgi:hypothetical protein